MIVQELSSLGGGRRSPSALVLHNIFLLKVTRHCQSGGNLLVSLKF